MRVVLLLVSVLAVIPVMAEKPQRIVSAGLCADQLLLQMVDRRRIASLSRDAVDPTMSYMADQVGDIPLNQSSAEEIIRFQPDLILASAYGAPDTVRLLRQLGYPVKIVPLPHSIAETYAMLRQVGEWVGDVSRAERLVVAMQDEIATLQQRYADKPEKNVIVYSPNGYTIGAGTLESDMMRLAGLRNLAEEIGIKSFQKISLEQLIAADPEILLIDNYVYNRNSLAHQYIDHPVLTKMLSRQRQLFIPSTLRTCAGPMTVDAIRYLAEHR